MVKILQRFLGSTISSSQLQTEVIAGFTTFLTMMYIIFVNPAILSNNTGMSFEGVLTATVLVSAFSTLMMGLYANNPIALAPGMGLNAFFVYGLIEGEALGWQVALGIVFWSGIIFLILSLTKVKDLITKSIPEELKGAITVGIGLFIAFIGLRNAGVIIPNEATIVTLAPVSTSQLLFWIGLIISSILLIKKIPGALIVGIILTTILAIPVGRMVGTETLVNWNGIVSAPSFDLFLELDFITTFSFSYLPLIFAFLFTDMIDSISLFIGVAEAANLKEENGEPRNMDKALITDSLASVISALFGTSSATSYIESVSGVEQGGRTGLTAVVCGLCFLPFLFLAPLVSIIPSFATAQALVLVGAFMMTSIKKVQWSNYEQAIPAFVGLILIPLTYSITNGIIWAFLTWTILKVLNGKAKEIKIGVIIIDIVSILAIMF